jgi:hypothetical protein
MASGAEVVFNTIVPPGLTPDDVIEALDHARITEGPGRTRRDAVRSGQHHVRMNKYIARSEGGTFNVVENLGHIDPKECEVGRATKTQLRDENHEKLRQHRRQATACSAVLSRQRRGSRTPAQMAFIWACCAAVSWMTFFGLQFQMDSVGPVSFLT